MMEKIEMTSAFVGICHMSVCCSKEVNDEEILSFCNSKNPSGTSMGWANVVRENYTEEKMRPVTCSDDPKRLHILVGC